MLNGSQAAKMSRLYSLKGKTAIITGSSRGIGRECALVLGRLGCNIVVAAKTVEPHPTLPGTIYTVAEEVRALNSGAGALPYQLDIRDDEACVACAKAAYEKFGSLDILINNASALWWQDIKDTPIRKYDLITSINVRGTFCMTSACLPYMEKGNFENRSCPDFAQEQLHHFGQYLIGQLRSAPKHLEGEGHFLQEAHLQAKVRGRS